MDFNGGFGNHFSSIAYYNYFSGNGFNLRQDLYSLSAKSTENDFSRSNFESKLPLQSFENEERKRTVSCPLPTTKKKFDDNQEPSSPAIVEIPDDKLAFKSALPEETLHILVTGPPRCGKIQLVEALGKRKLQVASDIGSPKLVFIQSFTILGMKVNANVWYMKDPKDCTMSLKDAFSNKNFVVILVYDVTVPKTLFDVREYILAFKRVFGINVPIILVGNKIDLRTLILNELSMLDWDFLAYCDGQQLKEEYKLAAFVECSGETGCGMDDLLFKASTVALADYFKF